MPGTQERVREAVSGIQAWLTAHPNPGEAIVRQTIVLRLLQAAGFDIWNPAEVVPEETNATGNRADFLIRAGKGKFALEIKGMGVSLGAVHFQQASTYAVNEGTRWAIVTNGRVWIAIDEHLPGKWEERVALRVELAQEGHTFADDLGTLLHAETWRANAFAEAVEAVQERQRQRRDEDRIHKEKRPVVEATQKEFGIATFEKAAAAAVQMGRITKAEQDVLLGKSYPPPPPEPVSKSLLFTYRTRKCEARVLFLYQPGGKSIWRMQPGSQCLSRDTPWPNFNARRKQMLEDGILKQLDETRFEFIQSHDFRTPSDAAAMISANSVNGWAVWKDAEGRSAQDYRPKN